jgi:guanyl-specific ribonuclease Sa
MIIKIAACLLTVAFFTACQSTQTASKRTTLREMYVSNTNASSYASSYSADEPAPPAEGPEDVPAEGPRDPVRNPALVPTPLLRVNAAGSP